MTDHWKEAHAYELIAEHLRLGGAPAQLPGWVAQTYLAAAEDLAAEVRLLATIERHRRTGYRFVVKETSEALEQGPGEAGYCVIDNDQRVQVPGPVTYEEASLRRDELMDAAIEATEGREGPPWSTCRPGT